MPLKFGEDRFRGFGLAAETLQVLKPQAQVQEVPDVQVQVQVQVLETNCQAQLKFLPQ